MYNTVGFDQRPQLKFVENEKGKILPTASLTHWLSSKLYDDFKTVFTSGNIDNNGFGGGP